MLFKSIYSECAQKKTAFPIYIVLQEKKCRIFFKFTVHMQFYQDYLKTVKHLCISSFKKQEKSYIVKRIQVSNNMCSFCIFY